MTIELVGYQGTANIHSFSFISFFVPDPLCLSGAVILEKHNVVDENDVVHNIIAL